MDMNTIEEMIPTADPAHWREGDAWLAGGTVLFSYGSSTLRRLLDVTEAGWQSVTITEEGLELAATCTVAELHALPDRPEVSGMPVEWPALELVRQCCDSFVASFKIWNSSTVGGNICTALPAGPMTSLCSALDGTATVLMPAGESRQLPVADLVTGNARTSLAPGELLRSIHLPAAALRSRVAFRRLSLSNLGRSGVLLIGRLDESGELIITVTAATRHPVQLRFGPVVGALYAASGGASNSASDGGGSGAAVLHGHRFPGLTKPGAAELRAALDTAIPYELYHDDQHGLPLWRRDMTYRLAEEIRAELCESTTIKD
ncbi:FAD binding domain-containing protein [Arthrobacter sp. H35-D1]|uniref:FAD binding domain-containing protein n=1 Tax=Arthrobacter sp. H35-D1 TaxID=3046202 RepID=UPI0024BAD4B8|nr:FAD binding domain-containing protein [Arthrobacter sp. H35-D1]MDJ0315437.1 FAD binding domain-containing protein [Arthrobacter sp. H35-D1]